MQPQCWEDEVTTCNCSLGCQLQQMHCRIWLSQSILEEPAAVLQTVADGSLCATQELVFITLNCADYCIAGSVELAGHQNGPRLAWSAYATSEETQAGMKPRPWFNEQMQFMEVHNLPAHHCVVGLRGFACRGWALLFAAQVHWFGEQLAGISIDVSDHVLRLFHPRCAGGASDALTY